MVSKGFAPSLEVAEYGSDATCGIKICEVEGRWATYLASTLPLRWRGGWRWNWRKISEDLLAAIALKRILPDVLCPFIPLCRDLAGSPPISQWGQTEVGVGWTSQIDRRNMVLIFRFEIPETSHLSTFLSHFHCRLHPCSSAQK